MNFINKKNLYFSIGLTIPFSVYADEARFEKAYENCNAKFKRETDSLSAEQMKKFDKVNEGARNKAIFCVKRSKVLPIVFINTFTAWIEANATDLN